MMSSFEDLPCIRDIPSRQETSEKLIATMANTPRCPRPLIGEVEHYLEDLVFSADNFTLFVRGGGIFTGVADAAGYVNLGRSDVNSGFLDIEKREIISIECFENQASDTDAINITYREDISYNYDKERLSRVCSDTHTFAPNSDLLLYVESEVIPILLVNVPTPRQICNEAALRCEGGLFPYDTLEECYQLMSSIPLVCEVSKGELCFDCVEQNAPYMGDTLQCRSLHLIGAKLRPTIHCPHLANVSTKCIQNDCPALPSRLPLEILHVELSQPWNATLPEWFRALEVVFAVGIFLLPVLTYIAYRRSRMIGFPISDSGGKPSDSSNQKHASELRCDTSMSRIGILEEKLPQIKCALRLLCKSVESEAEHYSVVLSASAIDFGGCKMTALSGSSGCGKSTLMKLLCRFPQSHMKLELEHLVPPSDAVYIPQSTEMWPRFMRVRDIFLFTSVMQGCSLENYAQCIKDLQLIDLLDQTFITLSGGQQQRVHILASLIRSDPSIVFMDEPISALDEANAVACLKLLRALPLKCAFVIAIHQMTPVLRAHFDRILKIDPETKKITKVHFTTQSLDLTHPKSSLDEASLAPIPPRRHPSFVGCVKALFYLWHSLFWGWPALDLGACLLGAFNASILGFMGKQSLDSFDRGDYIPSAIAVRVPMFMVQFIANVAALSAFAAALILSGEDRNLLLHFLNQGDLLIRHVVVSNAFRFAFYGITFATILMLVPLGIMGLLDDGIDTIVMNVAFFGAAYTYFCYVAALAVPPLYTSQVLLVTFLPITLFTGVFYPWDALSTFFHVLHYMNPLFYCLTACNQILLATFDPNCGSHVSPYLVCATPDSIREMTQLQRLGSAESQSISAGFFLLSVGLLWFLFHRRAASHRLGVRLEALTRHESIAEERLPPSLHRRPPSATTTTAPPPPLLLVTPAPPRRASSSWRESDFDDSMVC